MKKEMKREVEDALEILNGLISNYNDFFINESKPIPDEIKDTYLNVAKAFMNDLKEEDLKKYQKSSSYEDLVSKYNTLKNNVSEAESRIKEHNDKVIMLDKENKIKDMGEISSDASIQDDIITVPSDELLLVSSADDKLKYVTDKIKYLTSLEGTLQEEILILTYTNKDSKSYMNALKDYPNVVVMPINKFIYSLSDIKTTEVPLNKVIDEELSIEEDGDHGNVQIASPNKEGIETAVNRIKGIIAVPEIGEIYDGVVKSVMPYGAFVEFLPGKDGLLHVTEIDWKRIENVSDVLKEGENIQVKLIGIDKQSGKFKLSHRVLLPKPEGYIEPSPKARILRRDNQRSERKSTQRNNNHEQRSIRPENEGGMRHD